MREIWKPVPWCKNKYEVSDKGRIKNIRTGRIIKPVRHGMGSVYVTLAGKIIPVRKAVFETFKRRLKDGEFLKNMDGNWRNCKLSNLKVVFISPLLKGELWVKCKYPSLMDVYDVSNMGRIRNRKSKKIHINVIESNNGYLRLQLRIRPRKAKHFLLHRLVAVSFLGMRNGLVVMHKNNIKSDCCLSNLKYGTWAENSQHASKDGRVACGERNSGAKLTWKDIDVIRNTPKIQGYKRILIKKFNISKCTLDNILAERLWNPNQRQYGILR